MGSCGKRIYEMKTMEDEEKQGARRRLK